jgi:pimeloyl-ACP methyl ester carboxylesterase
MPIRPLFHAAALLACGLAFAEAPLPAATVQAVDRRQVEVLNGGAPVSAGTVVFENGLRETLDTWTPVLKAVAPRAHVFAYNRAGYGRSDVVDGSREGCVVVEELRHTLRAAGLLPPYVLVGHSMGGLYMQEFARAHPDEVAGVVLVDSVYPGVIKRTENFPLYARVAKRVFFSSTANREIDGIHATGDAVFALPAHDEIPMIRLFNVPKSAGAVGVDFGTVDEDPSVRKRVEALYPRAHDLIVDSDHRIQEANPEIVAKAIDDVLQLAAAPRREAAAGR